MKLRFGSRSKKFKNHWLRWNPGLQEQVLIQLHYFEIEALKSLKLAIATKPLKY